MSGEILSRLDQTERQPASLDVEVGALDDADDGYDPMEFAEEDELRPAPIPPPPTPMGTAAGGDGAVAGPQAGDRFARRLGSN
jgi:hypothetical protein